MKPRDLLLLWIVVVLQLSAVLPASPVFNRTVHEKPILAGNPFRNITLEMSLKPFRQNDPEAIRIVCREAFTQWHSLLRHADSVSILLWTSDGSEILDYRGDPAQPLEWGKYIGNPNSGLPVNSGPKTLTLHERAIDYMETPPEFSYGDLRFIVRALKEEGQKITGKPVRVGATFDPGPEFAKSDFKYRRHPEICLGGSMGKKSMVTCYATLNGDTEKYAGFPNGIPDGTPFGTFFGRQSQHFLSDLGFDFIWFSNGLGFGMETWAATGAVFDGKNFHRENIFETRKRLLDFWRLFRAECPLFRIETRGTNQTTGADMAADGVDLRSIYRGNFNILPPPNSPWAALNGDFGFELAGYMSRIAEIPDDEYLFRFYTHDPWWLNSPWLDRYEREAHDIYLPLAVARIDAAGNTVSPTHLGILSIDDSFGNMPSQVPDEVTPHILTARYDSPDAPGPLVWVYPFDEYHDWSDKQPERLEEIFFGDWFIRQAINTGLPLNTVVSTAAFAKTFEKNPQLYAGSILVTVVPAPDSVVESALIRFVQNGGRLLVYGPILHAGKKFCEILNVTATNPLEGEFVLESKLMPDTVRRDKLPSVIIHRSLLCGGGVETIVGNSSDSATKVLVSMKQNDVRRDVVVSRNIAQGKVVYVRGTNSASYSGGHLLRADNPSEHVLGGTLMRQALQEFGFRLQFDMRTSDSVGPITAIARSNNAFFFSTYFPNTTVGLKLRFPQGAPLLLGYETIIEDGCSTYRLPRAAHRECRVFVQQPDSDTTVYCKERYSGTIEITRRFEIGGLKNATVYIYPDPHITAETLEIYLNTKRPWRAAKGKISAKPAPKEFGHCFVVQDITGTLAVVW